MLGRLLEMAEPAWDERHWPPPFARPTLAGPKVETQESLTVPALFCGVNLLAGIMGSLPLPVLERISPRERREQPDHQVHQLLNVEANPESTSSAFRRSNFLHTFLWGNGIEEIQRNGTDPVALWPGDPETTDVKRSRETGELVYEFRRVDGSIDKLPGRNVLHPAGLGMDGVVGFGLIRHLARDNIGLAIAISRYAQSFFGNSTIIGNVLTFPQSIGKPARDEYARQIEEQHGGDKKFTIMVADAGAKVEKMGVDNSAAQMHELGVYSVQDIARWTMIPPPFLMELSHATYSNIKELSLWLVKFTLTPWLKVFEQEFTRKLFTREERSTFRVKYNVKGLLRGDTKAQAELYEKMLRNGVYTINMVLDREDENGIGPEGDVRHIELNRTTLKDMAENGGGRRSRDRRRGEDRDPDESNDVDVMARMRATIAEAHKPLLADAVGRMLRIQCRAVTRAQAKDPEGFSGWVDKYYAEHALVFRDAVIPCFEALGGAIRGTLPTTILDAEWDLFVGEFTKFAVGDCVANNARGVKAEGGGYFEGAFLTDWYINQFVARAERTFCNTKGDPICN